jgi:hypothetical protein
MQQPLACLHLPYSSLMHHLTATPVQLLRPIPPHPLATLREGDTRCLCAWRGVIAVSSSGRDRHAQTTRLDGDWRLGYG